MPHRSREVVEAYSLEIISRSQAIQEKSNKLLSMDFASDAPKALARTIDRMCCYLDKTIRAVYKGIDWSSNNLDINTPLQYLRGTDFLIRELGSHVRFIDGARTQQLPWSIISPFESFIEKIIPNTSIMLRPQWKYNYSVITNDLREVYLTYLEEYKDFLPDESLSDVFKDFTKSFHIISFPSLERKNILLHCLLGHEIGHLVSSAYISKRVEVFLKENSPKIADIVKKDYDSIKEVKKDLFNELQLQTKIQQEIRRAMDAWRRGLEELLSDIVGALLFGPAMLFSVFEIAIQDEFDRLPTRDINFYPPWRFRLREIINVLLEEGKQFFPLQKSVFEEKTVTEVNNQFSIIKEITNDTTDRSIIQKDAILNIAYTEIDKDIAANKILINEFLESKNSIIKSSSLYKKLPHLIDRLNNGIPPNAVEISVENRDPATLVEIINASWFHKISWEDSIFDTEGNFNDFVIQKRDVMNRLTLKAIEYAFIEENFRKFRMSQENDNTC